MAPWNKSEIVSKGAKQKNGSDIFGNQTYVYHIGLNFPVFSFCFKKQNPALFLKHYFHVLDVNVEVSVVVFSAIWIAFWMATIMKNIFDVAIYQKLHYGSGLSL